MTALPAPGETWLSRDGRVAWVFQNPDPGTREAYPIAAEYSDGAYCPLLTTGRYFATIGLWSPADLTHRSPWDAVREAVLTPGKIGDNEVAWDIWYCISRATPEPEDNSIDDTTDMDSEVLEFVAWAERQGLTPENLAEMRGRVAA